MGKNGGALQGLTCDAAAFAAIDFESSGASGEPVQIGMAVMEAGRLNESSFFRSYLAVDGRIDPRAAAVHGIDSAHLDGAPRLHLLWPEVEERLRGRAVVAHGGGTERRYLRAFPLHGFGPWVDTLLVARAIHPGLKSYALGDLARHFGIESAILGMCPDFRWHDALCDAVASLVLLRTLITEAGIGSFSAEILLRPDLRAYARRRPNAISEPRSPASGGTPAPRQW